ncbi:Mg-chelatase subunit ChlI [Streptomyces sp. V4I8]|uniref:hypothetical protein n=1 Tax=Streptomyces sp. V4I8 TaxID=3156469 RepID=UPI003514B982
MDHPNDQAPGAVGKTTALRAVAGFLSTATATGTPATATPAPGGHGGSSAEERGMCSAAPGPTTGTA